MGNSGGIRPEIKEWSDLIGINGKLDKLK